jgi:hypothetical protein
METSHVVIVVLVVVIAYLLLNKQKNIGANCRTKDCAKINCTGASGSPYHRCQCSKCNN